MRTSSKNVTCNGADDGVVKVFPVIQDASYPYHCELTGVNVNYDEPSDINNINEIGYFNNLHPGTYTLSVLNDDGCSPISMQTTFTITQPAPITYNAHFDWGYPVSYLTVDNIQGGNGFDVLAYTYYVHIDSHHDWALNYQGQYSITNPPQGDHVIYIVDTKNCQSAVMHVSSY